MKEAVARLPEWPRATDGELAVANLESSLQASWQVWRRWPERPGTLERIVDEEQRRLQFLGDATALDRLALLSSELCDGSVLSAETHLVAAQIAAMRHHFAEAKAHLARAQALGLPPPLCSRIRLSIDQALGENLAVVLDARQAVAQALGSLEALVPLAALLADVGEFEAADRTYWKAIERYRDVSPFAYAWVCFQLGVLWGETMPAPDPDRAAYWYQLALDYLPAYTHARVHLAEIYADAGELDDALALLQPVEASADPEMGWRLSQVLAAQGQSAQAAWQLAATRSHYETLLSRHKLAFADHAAEFYLGSGADPRRAFELARANLANRPTLRAFELAYAGARATGETDAAERLAGLAMARWGHLKAFAWSPVRTPAASTSAPATAGAGS